MPGKVKKGGSWRTMQQPHGKVGGAWRGAQKGWTKRGGIWVPWYSSAPPVLPVPGAVQMFRVHASTSDGKTLTFGWAANPPGDNVIDYEFICVPRLGGIWLGSEPFLSDTPDGFSGGVFQSFVQTGLTKTYNITTNGTNKAFRVRARNAYGYGEWSDIIHVATATPGAYPFRAQPNVMPTSLTLVPATGETKAAVVAFSGVTTISGMSIGVGYACTGGSGETSRDGLRSSVQSTSIDSPGVAAPTSANLSLANMRGQWICPSIQFNNTSYSNNFYNIVCTTFGWTYVPLISTDTEYYYTLTVGRDQWEGGTYPDRGYVRAGAHTNAQQVGALTPDTIQWTTSNILIQSLVKSGSDTYFFEARGNSIANLYSLGYTSTHPERYRMMPRANASYDDYTSSQWGYHELSWGSNTAGGWQFVEGQTYTMLAIAPALP